MFPNRRKKHLVTIFSQGHVMWPYDLLRFLRSVVCKWPVINVTILTLKIATQNTRLMGYFPIVLMKLFELYMF